MDNTEGIEKPEGWDEPKPEQKPAVQQAAVIPKRSEMKVWTDALKALPQKFAELQVESKRATIELGFAMQIIENNPALKTCAASSIYDAVIYSARIGITLNPAFGMAYLVPRGKKCCLDVGYRGWAAVLKSYGAIQHIDGYVVYEGEEFSWRPDLNELIHVPVSAASEAEQKARKVLCAYARATLNTGLVVFEVIPGWELEKIKGVSPAASKGFSPYNDWAGEMIRKAPIKRLSKKLQVLQDDDRVKAMFENEQRNDELGAKTKPAPMWDIEPEVL